MTTFNKLFLCTILCMSHIHQLIATVWIYNTTDKWIYAGVYYYEPQKNNRLQSAEIIIAPGHNGGVEEPPMSWDKDRYLVFDYAALKPVIPYHEFEAMGSKRVRLPGDYYIVEKDGRLKGYSWLEYSIIKPTKKTIQSTAAAIVNPIKLQILESNPAFQENVYQTTTAQVRIGNELCKEEKAYLEKRMPKVRTALEKLLNRPLTNAYIPKIALIGSGGGYRAMLCTLGSLVGASSIGLLDATTYITALSGSTWFLGPWMATGMPIEQYKKELVNSLQNDITSVTTAEMSLITDALLIKAMFGQTITLVDLFGALLANSLLRSFGNRRHLVHLSQQIEWIKHADLPLPIYTAIDGRASVTAVPEWYEFSPYEIGSPWLGMYVDTWAFGRKFINGVSVDFAPQQDFGFLMGIFGAAFALNMSYIWNELVEKIDNVIIKKIIEDLINPIRDQRISWGAVYNFSAGMLQSKIKNDRDIRLIDGGIVCNLPYAPVSGDRPERIADIMIFLDGSQSVDSKINELRKVEAYARQKGHKFPTIEYHNIDKRIISIFKDDNDPSVPVVIYMPRINNANLLEAYKKDPNAKIPTGYHTGFDVNKCVSDQFCGTFNFVYSPEQATELSAVAELNMLMSKQAIINEIKWVIDQKK